MPVGDRKGEDVTGLGESLDQFQEIETGEAFTLQGPRLLKVELSETSVMAKNGAMVAYQGDVSFEHKGGGLGRLLKKAATGEQLRLMEARARASCSSPTRPCSSTCCALNQDSITVNGANILAFQTGIDWDVTRVKGGTAGMLAGGLFNIHLHGTGPVALVSDGEPVKLDVGEAPTFGDPQAAIAWSDGVTTNLKTEVQAKTLIGMGSGESFQLGFSGQGWVLVQPSEGRPVVRRLVGILVLAPGAGFVRLRLRGPLEQHVEMGGDERVGGHHRVGVVEGPVLPRERDVARALTEAVLQVSANLLAPLLEPVRRVVDHLLTRGSPAPAPRSARARSPTGSRSHTSRRRGTRQPMCSL